MAISVIIWGIIILVVLIYVLFEFKRMRHKLFALFLIGLILFAFFSFNFVFAGKNIQLNSLPDFQKAAQMYFSWLGNAFHNIQIVTTNAIKMNWQGNKST
ncbi:Uncharacterised protein [uncultured archaeon]|nr:Uncharacterised protein [uncultured archaeon]